MWAIGMRSIGPVFWLILCIFSMTSCDQDADKNAASASAQLTPTVTIATTEIRSFKPVVTTPAKIEAIETAEIRPKISARVTAHHFEPGDMVKAGDVLFELDATDFEIALHKAQATLKLAQADQAQAISNFKRAQKLMEKNVISQRDFELADAKAKATEAQVEVQQTEVEAMQVDLQETKIVAPFDGKISAPLVAVGDPVSPLKPKPMARLVKLDPIYAVSEISQDRYNQFYITRDRMEAQGIDIPALVVSLILAGGQEYEASGQFQNWDSIATATSGTVTARVEFPNPKNRLLPGQNVTLKAEVIEAMERVMVPQKAVSQDQQGHFVLTVDDNNIVQRRNIEVGLRQGSDWAVATGLQAGEKVIVEGLQVAVPGSKVQINDASPL